MVRGVPRERTAAREVKAAQSRLIANAPIPQGRIRVLADGQELEPLLFGLAPLGMLLISDVSLTSHAALFVVPYAALVALGLRGAEQPGARMAEVAVIVAFVLSSLAGVRWLKELSPVTAAMLWLFGVSLYLVFRGLRFGAVPEREQAGSQ